MNTPKKGQPSIDSKENQENLPAESDAIEDDGSPVLEESDLAENNLRVEDAENIEWDDAVAANDDGD